MLEADAEKFSRARKKIPCSTPEWMRNLKVILGNCRGSGRIPEDFSEALTMNESDRLQDKPQCKFVGVTALQFQELSRVMPLCLKRNSLKRRAIDVPTDEHEHRIELPIMPRTKQASSLRAHVMTTQLQTRHCMRVSVYWRTVFALSESLRELDPSILRPMIMQWLRYHYKTLES